jgi:hypothetical protein
MMEDRAAKRRCMSPAESEESRCPSKCIDFSYVPPGGFFGKCLLAPLVLRKEHCRHTHALSLPVYMCT